MKIVDTDCFSEVIGENVAYASRFDAIDPAERRIAIITAEEVFRGWLAKIRAVQSSGRGDQLERAYRTFQRSIKSVSDVAILPYTADAHRHYLLLVSLKVRIGTRDLRIASIALAHDATLITRNRRDYELVPSLQLEIWN